MAPWRLPPRFPVLWSVVAYLHRTDLPVWGRYLVILWLAVWWGVACARLVTSDYREPRWLSRHDDEPDGSPRRP